MSLCQSCARTKDGHGGTAMVRKDDLRDLVNLVAGSHDEEKL